MNEESSYRFLNKLFVTYIQIPELIKHKKKILECRLCAPTISAMKGYSAFAYNNSEISYLIELFDIIQSVLKTMDKKERKVCEMISKEKNLFVISKETGLSVRTLFRKFNELAEKFREKINFKEGAGYERE